MAASTTLCLLLVCAVSVFSRRQDFSAPESVGGVQPVGSEVLTESDPDVLLGNGLEHITTETPTAGEEGNDLYEAWGRWSHCAANCKQRRKRKCAVDTICADDEQKEVRTCYHGSRNCRRLGRTDSQALERTDEALDTASQKHMDDVVYDLLYYDWSDWSVCTRSCKRRRYRTCALKRWCKNTVLLAEQRCYVPGTPCEEKFLQSIGDEPVDSPITEKPRKGEKSNTVRPSAAPAEPYNPDKCGDREDFPSPRIVGGYESRRGSWPWTVAILTRFHEQYCGGVLIAPQYVLTAAHCLRKRGRKRRVYVRVGEHDLSKDEGPEIDFRPNLHYVHPDFDIDTIDSDIAVLKLDRPVPVSRYTKYACVPEANDTLPINTLCYAVGWGKMKETHLFGTDVLREAPVPIVSQQKCQSAFDYEITESQMCAGYKRGGIDTCAGDSGGPLMCEIEKNGVKRWYVYGVTSFGEGCGDKGKFGIYSRVTNFSKWVIDATKGR